MTEDESLYKLPNVQFWKLNLFAPMELQKQNWKTQELRENLLSLLAKSDPGYQYLHCKCQRYTFSMSRENACLKMHNDSLGLNGTSAAGATPPKQSRLSEP